MSNMKNSTSPSSVGGSSMWFPMGKGDTSKFWPSYNAKPGMATAQGRMPANPSGGGMKMSKKGHY
jgi:hypothetical protein